MIQIDKDVPVQKVRHPARASKYPFAKMEVGDSFLAPNVTITSMCVAVYHFRMNHNPERMFTCRAVEGGVRVWRIA